MLSSPEAVTVDFLESGVNPNNTTLASKDDYKKMPKIKEMFTDPNSNKFDEEKFNTFYDHAVYGYNELVNKSEKESILDNIKYYDNQYMTPAGSKKEKAGAYIEKTLNPYKNTTGLFAYGKIEKGNLSVRELAQQNEAIDYKTGKGLGYTPNDSMLTALFKEPLAVAIWDEDGKHKDPITGKEVSHNKGEYKLNDNGEFVYENLDGRSPQGREVLNLTDTLTEEGSWANKYDFLDSDGLDKSITGSIFKTAFSIAPYFIPGARTAYTLYNTGVELADAIPSLTKAIAGLTGKDLDDMSFMNQMQSKARQLKSADVSDYAKNHTFGAENIMGIVSSSFGQLSSQRLIASIPSKLGASKKEVSAFHKTIESLLGKKQVEAFKAASYEDQLGVLNQLKDKSPDIASFIKKIDFWNNKGSRSISSMYMALTSATQTLDDAKQAGLDDQDAAMYYMGNVAGLYSLMNYTDIGSWALKGLGLDDINQSVNKVVKERSKDALKPFSILEKASKGVTETAKEASKKGLRLLNIFNSAKTNTSNLAKKIMSVDMSVNPYLFAALGEGTEEVSEELLADGLKLVYNGLNKAGFTSTPKDNEFDFTLSDIGSRYGMAFLGGGIGGMVFHANDQLLSKGVQKSDKDLLWLVRNGYGDKIKSKINELKEKSVFGSRVLTPQVYSADNFQLDEAAYIPTANKEDSQNDIIANMLLNEVNYIDNILQQNDIPEDKYLNDIYTKRINDIIDLGLNSALLDDANDLASQIVEDQININSIERPADTASNEEKTKYEQAVRKKQAVLDGHRMELQEIINGKSLPKYFKEAYFSTHGNINQFFGIKNLNDFSKAKFNKYYKELDEEERSEIEEDYENYRVSDRRVQLQAGLKRFEQLEPEVLKSKDKLSKIEEQELAYYNDEIDDDLLIKEILEEGGDEEFYMDRFNPELENKRTDAYNNLRIRQLSAKNQNINFSDYSFKQEYKKLNDSVNKEYNSLGFENINGAYIKKIIKTKQLRENIGVGSQRVSNEILNQNQITNFIESPVIQKKEFKDYKDQKQIELELADSQDKKDNINEKVKNINNIFSKSIQEFTQSDIDQLKEEGFSEELTNQYQNVLDQKDKLVNYIESSKKELNENLRVTPFLEILRDTSISTGEDNVTKALNLLQKYQEKLNEPNADLSKFIISNRIETEQLDKIKELIEQLNIVTDSLTEDNDTKGLRKDTTFGTASNIVLKKNGFESPYDGTLLTQDQRHRLLTEANRMYYQINFMQELSKYNQGDKIGYDKSISIAYKLNNISTLIPNGINSIFKDLSFISEEDILNPEINDAINYLTIKSGILTEKLLDNAFASKDIDLSDAEIGEFEKNVLKVEKFIYDKFQELDIDNKKLFIDSLFIKDANPTIKKSINEVKNQIQNTTDSEELKVLNDKLKSLYSDVKLKIKEDLDKKQDSAPTKFNSTLDNFNYIDVNSYLLEIISNPPQGFYVMLKGNIDEENKSDFSKSAYAPLQIQETLLRKTFDLVSGNSNKFSPIEYYYSKLIEDYFSDEEKVTYSNVFETGIKIIGYSGTGKSISISTLARIFENDNKNILIYSPIQKVSENLRNIVGERSNIINGKEKDSRVINELSKSILGEDLYNRAVEEIKTETIKETNNPNDENNKDSLVLRIVKGNDYIYKLNRNNSEIKEALSKINSLNLYSDASAIVIDEFTHLNPVDLDLLETTVRNHNNNLKENQNKLSVILIGDDSQEGYLAPVAGTLGNVSNIVCYTAPKMTDMIRAGYNVKIDNITSLLSLQNSVVNTISENQQNKKGVASIIGNNKIVLGYSNSEELGLIGEKIVDNISVEELTSITSKVNGKIGAIVSNVNGDLATKISNLPESLKSKIQIVQHNNVQGSEYDFTFIDIDPINYEIDDIWSSNNSIKQLYTLISRSKQGSLLTSNSIPKGLYISSSDANVDDSKAILEKESIEEYKIFRESVLDNIVDGEIYTKPKKAINVIIEESIKDNDIPLETPVISIPDSEIRQWNENDLVRAFELSSMDLNNKATDIDKKTIENGNISNSLVEFNKDKIFMYTFHERKSIHEGIPDSINLNGHALVINSKVKKTNDEYKEDLDIIKRSILANLTLKEAKEENITNLVDNFKYGVLDDYNIDFSNYDLVIESRLIDKNYTDDNSYVKYNKAKSDDNYKVISFINARFKTKEDKDVYFTLAALPNLNNGNVSKYEKVKDRLIEVENSFYDYCKKINSNPEEVVLIRKVNINDAKELSGLSFVKHRDKSEDVSLSEFRSLNENKLKISEPYIISNFNVIGNNFIDKRNLAGRPFVIVSNNPTIDSTELLNRYQEQIKKINNNIKDGKEFEIDKDTYMLFLNNRQIPFTKWMSEVHDNITNIISGKKVSSDFRTLENESQSAKLLTNLVNNIQWLNWALSIPRNKRKDYQNQVIDNILTVFYKNSIDEKTLSNVSEDIYERIFNVLNLNKSLDKEFFKSLNSNKDLTNNDKLNKINDKLVSTINAEVNSSENIEKSGIYSLLELAFEKEDPIYRLFTSYNNIKKYKFTSILEAMIYGRNYQGSSSKGKMDIKIGTDFNNSFELYNMLTSDNMFGDSSKEVDNMVYIKSVAANKSMDSINNPFAIKTVNNESDFIVNVEVLPSNIYMDLSNIEIEPIEESDVKIYKEKIDKKEEFKNIKNLNKFDININKYDYSLDREEIINEINKDLNNKIVILNSGTGPLAFNIRLDEDLNIKYDDLTYIFSQEDISELNQYDETNIDINESNQTVKIEYFKNNELSAIYSIDLNSKTFEKNIIENPNITKNSQILDIFANKFNPNEDVLLLINEIDKTKDSNSYINNVNKILKQFGYDLTFKYVDGNLEITDNTTGVKGEKYIENIEVEEAYSIINALSLEEELKANVNDLITKLLENTVVDSLTEIDNFINSDSILSQISNLNENDQNIFMNNLEKIFKILKC